MTTISASTAGLYPARQRIRQYADRALARMRLQECINAVLVSGTVLLWMLVLFLFADRMFSLAKVGISVLVIWSLLSALAIPYIIWRTFTARLHETLAAVLADDRLGLHARISTALTLDLNDPANDAFGEVFYAEALHRLEALNIEQAFPVRISRAFVLLLLPIGLSFAIYQFMGYQDKAGWIAAAENRRKADVQQQKAATLLEGKLEDMKKKVDEQADEQGGQFKAQQLIQQADKIARDLKDGKRNPDEALIALGQLKKQIENEKDKLSQGKEFLERLEKLQAKDLNLEDSDLTKNVSEALKMGDPGLAARQLRRMAQDIKKDILDNPNKTDDQKKQDLEKLKREVEKLAGALAEDEALRENLQELSEKMMDSADFQKLQSEIKKQMEKQNKGNKKHGDDIEKQIEQVAEELERLEEDNDVQLNEGDEKKMENLEAVEDGVNEAMEGIANESEEGEQKSQEAGGEPQQGKAGKPKSGKSGEKGARKGKSMQGRQKAGQGGQEGGEKGNQGGRGKGEGDKEQGNREGKPGEGTGAGPGQGLRPFRNIADPGFKAEQVKGQLQQGAITGLTHFRGQGAKGDAPTEFVKALSAAEQEASSSLELERIPSDAREVVRDYFSKVKQGANIQPALPGVIQPEKAAEPAAPKGSEKEALKE